MPQNKFALARYRLIDEMLRKKAYVKTIEIVDTCTERFGFNVTQRTIQMDMEALKHDPFLSCFFPISYSHYEKAYYYSEKPMGKFLSLCLSEEELEFLQNLKDILHNKVPEEEYQILCSIINKIENYFNT